MTIEIHKPELAAFLAACIRRGENVEDVLSEALDLSRRSEAKPSLAQFLLKSPLAGSGLNLDRQKDYPEPLEL